MTTEKLILKSLISNEKYVRAVLPYLKSEYFDSPTDKILFTQIKNFIEQYNSLPTSDTLMITLEESLELEDREEALNELDELKVEKDNDLQWLLDTTEQFCQDRAIHNAILDSIHILNGEKKNMDRGAITDLLKDALSISFDPNIGHDFMEEWEKRYEFYHSAEERIPFDIQQLNDITKGGLPRKTLNVLIAGVNVGKSLAMCHMAATNMMIGKNVLYITMEMAEEKIAERIDANVLDISLESLQLLDKKQYEKLIEHARKNYTGKLIVKEYPTASANINHFRYLLNELKLKKNFIPDIIYIDYLNICSSSRMKMSSNYNSYAMVKAIAEEIRSLAVEFDVPIVTATQLNRAGYADSDPDMTNTSESFGLPATADIMLALINTEELEKMGYLLAKQLKNRYNDVTRNKKFFIGVDRSKMRLYEVANAYDVESNDDEEVEQIYEKLANPNKFEGWKV